MKGDSKMNKTVKVIISVVLAVWIFAIGTEFGAYRERKNINQSLAGNNTPVVNTTVTPQTTAPTATQPAATDPAPTETTPASTEATTPADDNADTTAAPEDNKTDAIPKTNAEIAAAFTKAMNATKHATRDCHAVKNTNVQIQVTDCSVSSLTSMVNSIAQRFTGPETVEYNFVGGQDGDVTIYGDLPPSGRDITLDEGGIAEASAEPYGNGGYKLTIKLVPETSTLGNEPKYHANSVGFLDIESLGIDAVEFTKADFTYSGATVTICVNADGLVDTYDCVLPMAGTGEGKVRVISASATLEGSSTENWVFTWA